MLAVNTRREGDFYKSWEENDGTQKHNTREVIKQPKGKCDSAGRETVQVERVVHRVEEVLQSRWMEREREQILASRPTGF